MKPPRIVTFGEIMGRLAPPGFARFRQSMPGALDITFAGAEASVAVSIAQLGGEAAFVTALPLHDVAEACVSNLRSTGVDTRHILRTAEGRLGLYFLETGSSQRPGNVIYDREGSSFSITPADAYPWAEIFEGASWFHLSGISPAVSRNAAAVARRALEEASSRGLTVSCDMNFRSKLWRWDQELKPRELATRTMRELLPYVNVFMGGREDAAEMLGIFPLDEADPLRSVACQIAAQYPSVSHVAMTLREGISASHNNWGGLLYVAGSDEIHQAPLKDGRYAPYAITHIVDRLGGGDAFSAALIYALTTPELATPDTAVAFAAAASCLAHTLPGDFNYSTRAEVESLMGGATSGRVNR